MTTEPNAEADLAEAIHRIWHCQIPEINADCTILSRAQAGALLAEMERLKSQLSHTDEVYRHAYELIGACDIGNFLAKCEQARGFEEREYDLEQEVGRLKQLIEKQDRMYAGEVDEFNAGYQAAKDGLPESAEPFRCPHDQWRTGYAWGAFEELKAEVERLRGLLNRDKTGLAAGLSAVRKTVDGWSWLGRDGEWGCYEWQDHTTETIREEAGRLIEEVGRIAEDALRKSGDVVAAAFQPSTVKELEAEVKRLKAENQQLEVALKWESDEATRWREMVKDAEGHSKDGDGVDLLCKALYGRPGRVPDWLGGSEARMLYDAAKEVERLRAQLADPLERLRAWQKAAPDARHYHVSHTWDGVELYLAGAYTSACQPPGVSVYDTPRSDRQKEEKSSWREEIFLGTEDNPATFAEMADAALKQWAELYPEEDKQ